MSFPLTEPEIAMLESLSHSWRFFGKSLISKTVIPGTGVIESLITKGLAEPYMRVEAHITDAGREMLTQIQAEAGVTK